MTDKAKLLHEIAVNHGLLNKPTIIYRIVTTNNFACAEDVAKKCQQNQTNVLIITIKL